MKMQATKITVSPVNAVLLMGDSLQLSAVLTNEWGYEVSPSQPIVWSSSNPGLASVDSSGNVTAVSPIENSLNTGGQVTITATYPRQVSETISAVCVFTITVKQGDSGVVVQLNDKATAAAFGNTKVFASQPWEGQPIIGG
jgi:hypothetical protein